VKSSRPSPAKKIENNYWVKVKSSARRRGSMKYNLFEKKALKSNCHNTK
jgi:hypothetical protein